MFLKMYKLLCCSFWLNLRTLPVLLHSAFRFAEQIYIGLESERSVIVSFYIMTTPGEIHIWN